MDFIRFFIQKTGETSAQWQDRLVRSANSLASRVQDGLESRVSDLEDLVLTDQSLVLGADFGSQTARLVVAPTGSGYLCSILATSELTYSSTTTPSSSAVIPSAYRPTTNVENLYAASASLIYRAIVTTTGEFQVATRNYSGVATAATSSLRPPFVNWYVSA